MTGYPSNYIGDGIIDFIIDYKLYEKTYDAVHKKKEFQRKEIEDRIAELQNQLDNL